MRDGVRSGVSGNMFIKRSAYFFLLSVFVGGVAVAAGCHRLHPRTAPPRSAAATHSSEVYCNPLDVLLADPFIYRQGDTYYLYATSSDRGLLVWTSADLVNWRSRGYAFSRTPETWSRQHFWAPEVFAHRGKYYLHFTVLGGEKRMRRIVLAEGSSPLGPFQELKTPWFDPGRGT